MSEAGVAGGLLVWCLPVPEPGECVEAFACSPAPVRETWPFLSFQMIA